MCARHVIVGQKLNGIKVERARDLRKHMTDAEAILWASLRGRKLAGYRFRRQQVIDGFIVDFYCHDIGLVIELDGAIHADQMEYDQERDTMLTKRELSILRIPNDTLVDDLYGVLEHIEQWCQALAMRKRQEDLTPSP